MTYDDVSTMTDVYAGPQQTPRAPFPAEDGGAPYPHNYLNNDITGFCPVCGAEVREKAAFCMNCGAALSEGAEQPKSDLTPLPHEENPSYNCVYAGPNWMPQSFRVPPEGQ